MQVPPNYMVISVLTGVNFLSVIKGCNHKTILRSGDLFT